MTKSNVFISYARKDGAALAKRLYDDLVVQGYTVWLDTEQINSGAKWSNAIEAAIDGCDVALALLSEGSFISEICRAEQIMCLDKGKSVIPLLVKVDAPRPIHLYARQYLDFSTDSLYESSMQTLLDDLIKDIPISPRMTRRRFNNAPRLPQNFIAREEELNRLRDRVISDETDRKLALTALRGMGGIGKSVLAAAVCHDPLAQAAFPDGIVWVTIGRTPGSLVEAMRIVGEALGDAGGAYTSEATATSRLREVLREKSVLIVLDDAWDAAQVEPFLAEAPRCRFLITTREGKVAARLGANELRVGVMTAEQAVDLLREWAEHDDPYLALIAKRVGYLPLALKLAGARLREGMSGAEWLASFEHLSDIKLDYDSESPNENVAACLALSVSRLKPDEQPLYHALGIFKDETRIPDATITRLWQQIKPAWNDHQCGEFLQHLDRLALLERDPSTKLTTLHDLLNDYTQEKLKATGSYEAMHNALLTAYNPAPQKPWYEIDDDGYFYYYLAYHLIHSKRDQELFSLLTSSPQWMERKFSVCSGDASYMDDLQRSIARISVPISSEQLLESVRLCAAQQAVHSRANLYSDDALQVLTWLGQIDEALTHARLRTESSRKIAGLVAIADVLINQENQQRAREVLEEAHKTCLAISDNRTKAKSLGDVAESLAELDASLSEAIFEEAEAALFDTQGKKLIDKDLKGHTILDLSLKCAASGKIEKASHLLEWFISNFSVGKPGDEEDEKSFHSMRTMLKLSASMGLIRQKNTARALALVDEVLRDIDKVIDQLQQVQILTGAAHILVRTKNTDRAADCVHQALAAARQTGNISMGGFFGGWEEFKPEIRADALSQVAIATARIGDIVLVRNIINEIDSELPYYRAKALCYSSMQLKHIDLTTEANEFVQEAYTTALEAKEKPEHMTELMDSIAIAYAILEDKNRAKETLRQSREYAVKVFDNSTHAKAIIKVAAVFARRGLFDNALKVASLIPGQKDDEGRVPREEEHGKAISIIAQELVKIGETSRAYEIIKSASYLYRSNAALQDIAVAFARLGNFDQATKIASREIHYAHEKVIALAAVAGEIALHTDDSVLVEKVFEQALRENTGSPTEDLRWAAMLGIAEARLRAGQLEQARSILDSAFDNALSENWMSMDKYDRGDNVTKLVEILLKIGDLPKALMCFDRMHSAWIGRPEDLGKLRELCEMVSILLDAGETARGKMLVDDLLSVRIDDISAQDIADVLAKQGKIDEALELADKYLKTHSVWWTETLISIASILAKTFEKSTEKLSENVGKVVAFVSNLEPDYGIQLIANCGPAFEIIQPGLAVEVLQETIRILGWVRPDWQKFYELHADS